MRFRPCIDIHNGKVKQIVGGSLSDTDNYAKNNFVAENDSTYFAGLYREKGLTGGHIIILNNKSSEYYKSSKAAAIRALREYEGGLQIGGGINASNAVEFLNAGASHVIVTSYVFSDGKVNKDRLEELTDVVGKNRLVIDLSCRKRNNEYYVVTDRWQKFTDMIINEETVSFFEKYCSELLVHAVDVEGKVNGIEENVVRTLANYCSIPVTYAGGISSMADIDVIGRIGNGKIDYTVGSALDIYGGKISFESLCKKNEIVL